MSINLLYLLTKQRRTIYLADWGARGKWIGQVTCPLYLTSFYAGAAAELVFLCVLIPMLPPSSLAVSSPLAGEKE
jgi:hypothetical protein